MHACRNTSNKKGRVGEKSNSVAFVLWPQYCLSVNMYVVSTVVSVTLLLSKYNFPNPGTRDIIYSHNPTTQLLLGLLETHFLGSLKCCGLFTILQGDRETLIPSFVNFFWYYSVACQPGRIGIASY